ncbi:MAG: GYD domain-containing protein [Deltaproteobacteria bacterium]|nr:GYD domain-containing protein [Deltaproteobacteria bacterium]
METFFLFGRYSVESIQNISAKRTKQAEKIIRGMGGTIKSMYALLGERDVVLIVSLPGLEEAIKASIGLTKSTGIVFSTTPAVEVNKFDKMMA